MDRCQEIINSDEYNEFFIQYRGELDELTHLKEIACIQNFSSNYVIASIKGTFAELYGALAIVPRVYGPMARGALEAMGILELRRRPVPDLYGKGVIIGIVDDGIDIFNTLFIREDGSSRVSVIWDQADTRWPPPRGFLYGI